MKSLPILSGATFGLVVCMAIGLVPPWRPVHPVQAIESIPTPLPVFYIISATEFPDINGDSRVVLQYAASGIVCVADFPDRSHLDHFIHDLASQGEIRAYSDMAIRGDGIVAMPMEGDAE